MKEVKFNMNKIMKYLKLIDQEDRIYVDIGASNITNLNEEYINKSNCVLFIEPNIQKASRWKTSRKNFHVINDFATPLNIKQLLSRYIKEENEITYLDIDIDGYDFFVLSELLNFKRPLFFVAEINEKIPPPIKFTVKYHKNYFWDTSHFYGMSISKLYELIRKFEYDLIDLDINNAICIRKDKNITKSLYQIMKHIILDIEIRD